ncbi:class I SAM-dependent DNA methyltransferase [Jannaschia sp. R86511]|uniref:class I SAM-dependent DNA methyltransferase n=1 Tax=Jannaschia sp. R86511 TaxID=3093853 RepID=UPI0036D20FCC
MTLPPEYFARAWADDDDPWRIADRWYERRKRDLLLAVLPRERFARGLELGCAAGHLTERLAGRCEQLLACDVDARAVDLTRARLARAGSSGSEEPGGGEPGGGAPGRGGSVTVEQRRLPEQWPEGRFDLVVVSEVGYYLGEDDLGRLAERAAAGLGPDGVLVACHWRHPAPGYPGTAEGVHTRLGAAGLDVLAHHEEPDLLLDVWTAGEPSVARAEGWLG